MIDIFLGEFTLANKLYVGNISYDLNNDDLQNLFQTHGTVISARIVMDRDTGRSKGFGFVEMSSTEEANAAIHALNGTEINGRALTVNEARPQTDRGSQAPRGAERGGFRGGRGNGHRGGHGGGKKF
ncbi:MAG: RNA-binding protein [Simkaniaceae bacterium]|nr:RNA-binding protein [Simkaniaceae bacterium]MCF7852221.1 RNA-binding protein [Simkaniaceae bacterium]